jgi:polygalacturonase
MRRFNRFPFTGGGQLLLPAGALLLLASLSHPAKAADAPVAKTVTACAVLHAELTDAQAAQTAPADTARLQKALNACNPGEAVILEGDGAKTAFLSAPLVLPRGVFLYLAKEVTLYASRNPRDYDLAPQSCGGPLQKAAVCKPFLFAYQAARSGILGAGTIDGQGWTGGGGSAPDLVSSYESQEFSVSGVTLRHAAGVHLSIYKTIGFRGEDVRIPDSAGAGVLLSNAQDATLENFTIHTSGTALDLRASILGATERVKISRVSIAEGGIHLGDPVYGAVRKIEFAGISLNGSGLDFDLRGSKGGELREVKIDGLCITHPTQPLRVEGAPALPAERGIVLENATVNQQGRLTATGLQANPAQGCNASADNFPGDGWQIDRSRLREQGTKASLVVAADGSGDFTSVEAAVRALPATGGEITVRPGSYREVVSIRKPHVHLHGSDSDPAKTVIVFDNTSPKSAGTFNSATVFVEADDVTLDHLTIANDSGNHGQAVALHITADRGIFHHLRILGAQDTLFAAARYCYGDYGPCVATRQFFSHCYVEGNVDFIFGDSMAVFEKCELHGIAGHVMYTAAGRHTADQQAGYVFDHCHLSADPQSEQITLGRPWRPYARVIYLDSVLDAPIIPAGWTEWPRFGVPSFPTAVYAEFNSSGSGASDRSREPYAKILSAAEAEPFRAEDFLAGEDHWNPAIYLRK